GGTPFPTISELPYLLTLPPYGFYWFELSASAAPPAWRAVLPEQMPDYVTLVVRRHAGYQLLEGSRRILCNEVLPQYLDRQRWFGGTQRIKASAIFYIVPLPGQVDLFLAEFQVEQADGPANYFLPLALLWTEPVAALPQQYALARIRRGSELGLVTDAFSVAGFALALLENMRESRNIPFETSKGRFMLQFQGEPGLAAMTWPDDMEIAWFQGEQTN